MKYLMILLTCAAVFSAAACKSDASVAANITKSEPAATPAPVEAAPRPDPVVEKTAIRVVPFQEKDVPARALTEGELISGAHWFDRNGENFLLVSQSKADQGDLTKQYLYADLFVVQKGKLDLLWQTKDWAENHCDAGAGLVSPIDVRDLDGDGVAENMFVYNVEGSCDVSPRVHKLMFHSGDKKLAIRGSNTVNLPEGATKGEKKFDDTFKQAPAAFRTAASDFWDKYVKPFGATGK